jgi:photosystem II stability/assembly factor-like uncharacterized protein
MSGRRIGRLVVGMVVLACALTAGAQVDPGLYGGLRWRMIGPFRGGRTVGAVGVPGQPNVFYIGVNNGGVWKTTDYGRTWLPIFDDQPTGSIGAVAVAPSDPNIIYVGSGEGLQRPDLATGDGIYRSADAGKSWTHLGLRDGQQIPAIIVDPKDPNRLFVAVLGHPYGPNAERGIYRSVDGGRTFQKVLYRDENTGGMDLAFDPSDAQTVYAVLWEARQGPWENAQFRGPNSGLFKSTDGGTTWKPLTAGLPGAAQGLSRIGIEVSASDPKRLYAVLWAQKGGGLYRSDDAGESWRLINSDDRLWERDGDFNEVRTDPKSPDVVYVANVVTWKSTDGGKTFAGFRGAPGGDDYHRIWVNPDDPKIILIASDQGAIVTVNGGESWSSWYNQPTAQFYHVNADNAFPYRVCGGQQESGSACVVTRSDEGQITARDWMPAAVEEYGYAVPDPLDPDIVVGGKLSRWDRRTRQVQNIAPKPLRGKDYRVLRTAPVVFSPLEPHVLYFASNTVWKTGNGGKSWTRISGDLTRKQWEVPAAVGVFSTLPSAKPSQRGVVYALAPSFKEAHRIWAGTDDGLIQVTADGGKSWQNVTPAALVPWDKVSIIEASHFDALTAYAAVNAFRLDDLRPHIYRTRDGGKSWSHITSGLPDGAPVNVVREDPEKKGLLFAGTELAVYFSIDDGDHWQPLRMNMPATSIRDLAIHEDDVIAGTHGRGFWILDDVVALRQLDPATAAGGAETRLFKPAQAWRFRWNKASDTPPPPDEPAGQNPPDGALIDYYLAEDAKEPVRLEILDGAGKVIRRYASTDPATHPGDQGQVPWYWIRPPHVPATTAGMHRFVWDLHYQPVPGTPNYGINAVPHDTPPAPTSPYVHPGRYRVRLTVGERSYTQLLTVKMDPRVKTSPEGLLQQFTLSKALYDDLLETNAAVAKLRGFRLRAKALREHATGSAGEALNGFSKKVAALEGAAGDDDEEGPAAAGEHDSLGSLAGSLRGLLRLLQEADASPTSQAVSAITDRRQALAELMVRYHALEGELPALNGTLKGAGLEEIAP